MVTFKIILFLLLLYLPGNVMAGFDQCGKDNGKSIHEQDSAVKDDKRLCYLIGGKTISFAGAMVLLDYMWYRDFPRTSFQFHNDNHDWKQMDKFGHVTTAYHLGSASFETFRWAGLDNRESAIYGSITSALFMTSIEVMDGFSEEWGFSWGDQVANLAGAGMFLSQQLAWESQEIKIRYSYRSSGLEGYRPDLFGSNNLENLIKDYNGMTFWLSTNVNFLTGSNDIFPPWFNIAIGYSAYGMLGSRINPDQYNGIDLPHHDRYRQWFFAPDADLSKIDTDSKVLQVVFKALDFIKFPAPAVEYNGKYGWGFHLVYF